MKRVNFTKVVVGFIFVCAACSAHHTKEDHTVSSGSGNKGDAPYMYVKEDFHDFGKITEGEKVSYSFTLENRGKKDLVLNKVDVSCGCTVAKWDQKPVHFNSSTNIEVVFNSEGKIGIQHKSVTIISNADPDIKTLTFRCEVVSPNNNSKTE